jgi:hypothetical protein
VDGERKIAGGSRVSSSMETTSTWRTGEPTSYQRQRARNAGYRTGHLLGQAVVYAVALALLAGAAWLAYLLLIA